MKTQLIENIVCGLFEQIAHYRSANGKTFEANQGMMFNVVIDSECHGFEQDGNTHHPEWQGRCIFVYKVILLSRCKVFVHISEDVRSSLDTPQEGWINTSNHNSCWRHDGLRDLFKLAITAEERAFAKVPEAHRDSEPKLNRVDLRLGFGSLGKVFKLVEVDMENDLEKDPSGYFKKLTAVRLINKEVKL